MTVGDKIRKIRTFRGMTQKELGVAIGLEEKGADNRIAQYETNYRALALFLATKSFSSDISCCCFLYAASSWDFFTAYTSWNLS